MFGATVGGEVGEVVLGECGSAVQGESACDWLRAVKDGEWTGREMGIKLNCDGKRRRFEGSIKIREVFFCVY